MCHLQALYAKHKGKGLVVVGFNAMDDKTIAVKMLAMNCVTFPNIVDASDAGMKVCNQVYQRAGMNGVPLSYIIGRDGKIVAAWYGGKEEHARALKILQKLGGELGDAIRRNRGPVSRP